LWQIEHLFFFLKHVWMPKELPKYSGPNAAAECVLDGCAAVDGSRARGFFRLSGYKVPEKLTDDDALLVLAAVQWRGLL